MGSKCGIIGLPNVGKSTLFKAITKLNVKISNFPFCTIRPNIGIVPVLDMRLDKLAEIVKPKYILPTTMEFIDIAGLVKGASKGQGLGNQFLANIRETEAIVHVVRCFENKNIIHITNKVNPAEDISIINTELILSDLDTCKRAIHCLLKKSKIYNKDSEIRLEILQRCFLQLEDARFLKSLRLNEKERELIHYLNFLTLKPIIYIANINDDNINNKLYLDQIFSIAKQEDSIVIAICAVIEANIVELDDEEKKEFMKKYKLKEVSLSRIISACYKLLNLQTFFTVSTKEIRAWTIPIGYTVKKAAGKIHSDLERGFIRAKIIAYEDFITCQGEKKAKEAGKIRIEGKDYLIKDGDIVNIMFNV